MILPVFLCAVLASTALGNDAANYMMDKIIAKMTFKMSEAHLEPADVSPFMLQVNGNGLTRQFKARIVKGSLKGLDMIRRVDDCSVRPSGHETIVACFVSLGSLRFFLDADVKGDHVKGDTHSISTTTAVNPDSKILIELKGLPDSRARIARVTTRPFTMKTTLRNGKVDLNSERLNESIKNIHDNLGQQLESILKGPFSKVLDRSTDGYSLP